MHSPSSLMEVLKVVLTNVLLVYEFLTMISFYPYA